jgi:hypothetical protein
VSLEETQRLFLRAITWPTGVGDFLDRADGETRAAFERTFGESAELGRVARLDIYANAYFYRLLDALKDMFPRLAALAGDTAFHDLITDYLLAHPPARPDLRHAGDALPGFVASHALGRELPPAADVARVERALNHALDAPQGGQVERAALAIIEPTAWPNLTFELSVPSSLVAAQWDVAEVARRLVGEGREAALALERAGEPLWFLVGRRGFGAYFRRLGPAEATALRALQEGYDFGRACELVARAHPGTELADIARDLMRWVDHGVVARVNHG